MIRNSGIKMNNVKEAGRLTYIVASDVGRKPGRELRADIGPGYSDSIVKST